MIESTKRWRITAIPVCVLIVVIVLIAPGPNTNLRSALAIHDYGHVVAFGLVTMLVSLAIRARSRPSFQARFFAIWLAAGTALALGTAVELMQAIDGSGGDWWDVVRDGGGAISAALILIAFDRETSKRSRVALVGFAASIVVAFTYPTVSALRDEARSRSQFPVLVNFESSDELSRFSFGEGIEPRTVQITSGNGKSVSGAQLHLPPGKYPGFSLRYFPRDWSGMRALRLLIVNPGPMPIEMTVRIDDAKYNYKLDLSDRYNRSFPIVPGTNQIEIALSDVASAPRGRTLDLARVQSLIVYAADLEQGHDIIVGPIALLR